MINSRKRTVFDFSRFKATIENIRSRTNIMSDLNPKNGIGIDKIS